MFLLFVCIHFSGLLHVHFYLIKTLSFGSIKIDRVKSETVL